MSFTPDNAPTPEPRYRKRMHVFLAGPGAFQCDHNATAESVAWTIREMGHDVYNPYENYSDWLTPKDNARVALSELTSGDPFEGHHKPAYDLVVLCPTTRTSAWEHTVETVADLCDIPTVTLDDFVTHYQRRGW